MTDREHTTDHRGSHGVRTHWQRFFHARQAAGMDSLDTTVDATRGATSREWEVFCRESEPEPLTHVGSVSAPTAAVAREQATSLFGHAATSLWLCPADETVRVQDESLGVGRVTADDAEGDDAPTMETGRMEAETLRGGAE